MPDENNEREIRFALRRHAERLRSSHSYDIAKMINRAADEIDRLIADNAGLRGEVKGLKEGVGWLKEELKRSK
jgi:hypothetical protein